MSRYALRVRKRSIPAPDGAAESGALIADTAREFEHLSTALSSVRFARTEDPDWRTSKEQSTFSWSGKPRDGRRSTGSVMDDDDFTDESVVPANTKAWLKKARHTRRMEVLHRVVAWTVTIGIGGLIVALAVFLVTGSLPDFSWLFSRGLNELI